METKNEKEALRILNLKGNIGVGVFENTRNCEVIRLEVNREYVYYLTLYKINGNQSLLSCSYEEKAAGKFYNGERLFSGEFNTIRSCLSNAYHFLARMGFPKEMDVERTRNAIAEAEEVYYEDVDMPDFVPKSETEYKLWLLEEGYDNDNADYYTDDFTVQSYILIHALRRYYGLEAMPKLVNREGESVEYVNWVCLDKSKYFDGVHAVAYDESEIYHLQDCYGQVFYVFRCNSWDKAVDMAKEWLEEYGDVS